MSNFDYIIKEMTDEELLLTRNEWNRKLPELFHTSSGDYDTGARIVREVEAELNRREHEGPPWAID
jgi:hypothetical protein